MPLRRLLRRLLRTGPKLAVPEKFNRNSSTVTALMTAEQSGVWLLERMRGILGRETLAGVRLLDFGCGVRFAQAILNTGYAIGAYAGVDNYEEMIDFLRRSVRDRRFTFEYLGAQHALYNPGGKPIDASTRLAAAEQAWDVVSMFSVITHQDPEASAAIFRLLRRYVTPGGHLFFTCFLDESIDRFEDRSERVAGERCFYNPRFLEELVEACGWSVVRQLPNEAPLIAHSFLCRAA